MCDRIIDEEKVYNIVLQDISEGNIKEIDFDNLLDNYENVEIEWYDESSKKKCLYN